MKSRVKIGNIEWNANDSSKRSSIKENLVDVNVLPKSDEIDVEVIDGMNVDEIIDSISEALKSKYGCVPVNFIIL